VNRYERDGEVDEDEELTVKRRRRRRRKRNKEQGTKLLSLDRLV